MGTKPFELTWAVTVFEPYPATVLIMEFIILAVFHFIGELIIKVLSDTSVLVLAFKIFF